MKKRESGNETEGGEEDEEDKEEAEEKSNRMKFELKVNNAINEIKQSRYEMHYIHCNNCCIHRAIEE